MTEDDTIKKSEAVEYVLENHWDEVREQVLDDIREKIFVLRNNVRKSLSTTPFKHEGVRHQYYCEIKKYNEFLEMLK